MKRDKKLLTTLTIICCIPFFYILLRKPTMTYALTAINTSNDVIALFPTKPKQIMIQTELALNEARNELAQLIAIPLAKRTYDNTAGVLDQLVAFSNACINAAIAATLHMVHPDEQVRNQAQATVLKTQNFLIDQIFTNADLYRVFKEYCDCIAPKENLRPDQLLFLEETMDNFRKSGLELSNEQRAQVIKLKKEMVELELLFDKNIAHDQSTVAVRQEELAGLSPDFIDNLQKTEDGLYILGIDYPTYTQIMENCNVEQTRKQLWRAFNNRAYPANKEILEQLIAKRYELAQLLGFTTYAALELHDQMVKSPERAATFMNELNVRAQKKAERELKEFSKTLPDSISLTTNNKLKPWDVAYLKNQYKKSTFNIDENKIAEYFPVQHTIDSLLAIYQTFFSLEFKQLEACGLWHSDVKLIEVIDKSKNQLLGYLFLDLFPRPNKYNHACEHSIIPVTYNAQGLPNLGVSIVIANFPKPTGTKPALLKLKDVTTFFHEFGHAMHALLGRTKIIAFAGTNVKRDFVEMPSQMLEEWLWDPAILKMVSKHYQTGDSLPDAIIDTILKTRTFDSGFFIARQLLLANLSLEYFNNGPLVNLDQVFKKLFEQFMAGIQFDEDDHFYASFGHLTGYGARYYGYMWSKVFAHHLFAHIKREGLLNPVTGQRYIAAVLSPGGSKDPNDLLYDFLGMAPNQDAFLLDMGLL